MQKQQQQEKGKDKEDAMSDTSTREIQSNFASDNILLTGRIECRENVLSSSFECTESAPSLELSHSPFAWEITR